MDNQKCKGFNRYGDPCRFNTRNEYCHYHDYTKGNGDRMINISVYMPEWMKEFVLDTNNAGKYIREAILEKIENDKKIKLIPKGRIRPRVVKIEV